MLELHILELNQEVSSGLMAKLDNTISKIMENWAAAIVVMPWPKKWYKRLDGALDSQIKTITYKITNPIKFNTQYLRNH
jgi:hypothetical protein